MDLASIGATLTVVGLLIEVGAVYRILHSVGVTADLRQRVKRGLAWVRRYLPGGRKPRTVTGKAEMSGLGRVTARGHAVVGVQPAPTSFSEVDQRLKQVVRDMEAMESRLAVKLKETQEQIEVVDDEAIKRHTEIEERIESYVRQVLSERRREAIAFAGGLFLQFVGAIFVLAAL